MSWAIQRVMSESLRNGSKWRETRVEVREREDYCCEACGKEGSVDSIDDLQVHHIRAVEDGGTNDIDNLALVCNYCHWEIHRKGPENGRYPVSLAGGNSGWESDFQNTRMEFSESEQAVLGSLAGRGEVERREIIDDVPFTATTVSKALRILRIAGRVTKVNRGVYRLRPVEE